MGQAKNRGTQEQRIALAVERKEAAAEVRRQEMRQEAIARETASAQRRVSHLDGRRASAVIGGSRNRLSSALVIAMAVGLSSGLSAAPRKDKL